PTQVQAAARIVGDGASAEATSLPAIVAAPSAIAGADREGTLVVLRVGVAAAPAARRGGRAVARIEQPRGRAAGHAEVEHTLPRPGQPIAPVGPAAAAGVVGVAPAAAVGGRAPSVARQKAADAFALAPAAGRTGPRVERGVVVSRCRKVVDGSTAKPESRHVDVAVERDGVLGMHGDD